MAHARRAEVEIVSVTRDFGAHPYRLHLAVAPTKNIDRFEWFVEKATEIGFDTLTPIVCRYSERRVIKPERVEKILVSAAKQSLKARVPELREMVEFDRLVEQCSGGERLIAHCHDMPKVRLFDACGSCRDVTVCIGPEGDFSTEEVERAMRAGWRSVSLGESRLRTETAGVVACHTVGLRFGV